MYLSENEIILVVWKFWPLKEIYQKMVRNIPFVEKKVFLQNLESADCVLYCEEWNSNKNRAFQETNSKYEG